MDFFYNKSKIIYENKIIQNPYLTNYHNNKHN